MRILLILLLTVSFVRSAYGQTDCYEQRLQRGKEAYESGDYEKAILRWQAGLDNCELSYSQRQTLNNWIEKARNPPTTTTRPLRLSYEPEMKPVRGGTFNMGSNDGDSDEKPIHSVTVSDFYMGVYEVTVGEYLEFCKETNSNWPEWLEAGNQYHVETGSNAYYKNKGYYRSGSEKLPIIGVSWNDAVAYCQWLSQKATKNYRLPTEAEWEFAARGGNNSNGYTCSGSNSIGSVAWYTENSNSKPHPVGDKNANELGLYDMSGNVWEWCSDWYDENYYANSPSSNPLGPSAKSARVCRGGFWFSKPVSCRVAVRYRGYPSDRNYLIGFRVVRR